MRPMAAELVDLVDNVLHSVLIQQRWIGRTVTLQLDGKVVSFWGFPSKLMAGIVAEKVVIPSENDIFTAVGHIKHVR